MEKAANFLKLDYNIQKVLLIITVLSVFTFYFIGLALIILGFWQIVSGLYGAIKLKSKKHQWYVVSALSYLVLMFLLFQEVLGDAISWFIILMMVVPFGIAIWYFRLTRLTWEILDSDTKFTARDLENILDSEEMLR